MAARWSWRFFKRQLYSFLGISNAPLFKSVGELTILRRTNSESVIPRYLPPGTEAWFLYAAKAGHDRPFDGMPLSSGELQGEDRWGTLEQRRKARSIRNCDCFLWPLCTMPVYE